jgi:APA family basic amino acid/polyamine antiporter
MRERNNNKSKKKSIGLMICTALVIGNMIGSGIFLLPASLAQYGGVSIIGWMASAFGAIMTALVFVRLSKKFPSQGGPYRYAYDNFGTLAGFSVAWSYWISIWCGNAAIAVAAVSYLGVFFPSLNTQPITAVIVAFILIWSLTLVNMRGVRQAGLFQLMSTILKLIPLIMIGLAAFFVFEPQAFVPFNLSKQPLQTSIAATAALTLWAFLGMESATIPADTIKNPSFTIPRATIVGVLITAAIYISSQVAVMSVVPNEQLQTSGAPFADAARMIWGQWAGNVVAVGAIISCIGALNGWILLQGQVPMTAARDKLFPQLLADKDKQSVSKAALVISSFIVSLLVATNYNDGMVTFFTFAIMIATLGIFVPYVLSIAAELKSIHKSWHTKKQLVNLTTTLLALIYCIWAISGIGSKSMLWGMVLILSGLPIYFVMSRKNKVQNA